MNHWHGRLIAGVITRPLAERSFGHDVVNADFTLDGDFRVGGNRQAGERAFDHLQRPAEDPAGIIVFVDPIRHVGGRNDKIDWMMAEGDRDRKTLSLLMIFFLVDPSMLSRRHVQCQAVRAVNHNPVGADVYPILFWIARNHQIVGADITSTVQFVPARHRKLEHVDVFTLLHVLEEWTGRNGFGSNRSDLFNLPAPGLDEIYVAQTGFHSKCERQALRRRDQIRRDAIALRVISDAIENNRRSCLRALVDDFRKGRELEIPVNILDSHQLAQLVDFVKPST